MVEGVEVGPEGAVETGVEAPVPLVEPQAARARLDNPSKALADVGLLTADPPS
jgi:hypothetical protein